jgi:hypothetical protein
LGAFRRVSSRSADRPERERRASERAARSLIVSLKACLLGGAARNRNVNSTALVVRFLLAGARVTLHVSHKCISSVSSNSL